MKVLIQYTQAGKYRDQAWESLTLRSKGDMQAVTPSYAAQLNRTKQSDTCDDRRRTDHLSLLNSISPMTKKACIAAGLCMSELRVIYWKLTAVGRRSSIL